MPSGPLLVPLEDLDNLDLGPSPRDPDDILIYVKPPPYCTCIRSYMKFEWEVSRVCLLIVCLPSSTTAVTSWWLEGWKFVLPRTPLGCPSCSNRWHSSCLMWNWAHCTAGIDADIRPRRDMTRRNMVCGLDDHILFEDNSLEDCVDGVPQKG